MFSISKKPSLLNRVGKIFMSTVLSVSMLFTASAISVSATSSTDSTEDAAYAVVLETTNDATIFSSYLEAGGVQGRDLLIPDSTEPLYKTATGSDSANAFYFNKTAFDSASETNKKAVLGKLYDIFNTKDLEAAKMTPKSRQILMDAMSSRSPEANALWTAVVLDKQSGDVATGVTMMSGFLPYVRVAFGIILIVIILGIIATTALDLGVLLVPAVNDFMSKRKKDNGTGEDKIPFISKTCATLLKESTSSGDDGKGAKKYLILTYFARRSFEIIIAVVALSILLLGSFGTVVTSLMDAVVN